MSLPLKLLYSLQITHRQKAGLASVFLLAVIIIVVAIVRASQIGGKLRTDSVLLTVWSLIESTICKFCHTVFWLLDFSCMKMQLLNYLEYSRNSRMPSNLQIALCSQPLHPHTQLQGFKLSKESDERNTATIWRV